MSNHHFLVNLSTIFLIFKTQLKTSNYDDHDSW